MAGKVLIVVSTPLGDEVRRLLNISGMSQTEFCTHARVDQGLMSKIMNGRADDISLETSLKLAKGFDVNPQTLISLSQRRDEWLALLSWLRELDVKQPD